MMHRRFQLTLREAIALAMPAPVLRLPEGAPRGDGHTVLVLPGWFRGDGYTAELCALLRSCDYNAVGWELGVNFGPTRRLREGAAARLDRLSTSGPISLVGFSMGGLFARWLALRMPSRVRRVITACSPIPLLARFFRLPLVPMFRLWPEVAALARDVSAPLPVSVTALYSREDGLWDWRACLDPAAETVEIGGPHVLAARNSRMLATVLERLADHPERVPSSECGAGGAKVRPCLDTTLNTAAGAARRQVDPDAFC